MLRTGNLQYLDLPLVLCTLAAAAVRIIMVFSATKTLAAGGTINEFVLRQAIYAGVGIVLMLIISRINYRFLESFTLPLYLGTLGLLGLVMVLGAILGACPALRGQRGAARRCG